MNKIELSNNFLLNIAKIFFPLFCLGLIIYLFFHPHDVVVWFLLILLTSVALFKIRIHKFKTVSFDDKFIYINNKPQNFSKVDKIYISYFNISYVKVASRKYRFSISMADYSNREKINELKKYIPSEKIIVK